MNEDEMSTAQSTALSPALRAQAIGYPISVSPRYELRDGKFGPYFHDTRGSGFDMPLEEVVNTLNRYALRKAQLTWFVANYGDPTSSGFDQPRGLSASEAPGAAAVTPNPPEVS